MLPFRPVSQFFIYFVLLFCSEAVISDLRAKLPVPRFVSLRSDHANVRVGPGRQYPIQWVLVRKFLPLEVIAEFDTWRKVKDHEGETIGWVHQSLLSGHRTAMICENLQPLYYKASTKSFSIAQLEMGVIVKVRKCHDGWCRVQVDSQDGWVETKKIWGVYPREEIR